MPRHYDTMLLAMITLRRRFDTPYHTLFYRCECRAAPRTLRAMARYASAIAPPLRFTRFDDDIIYADAAPLMLLMVAMMLLSLDKNTPLATMPFSLRQRAACFRLRLRCCRYFSADFRDCRRCRLFFCCADVIRYASAIDATACHV